MRGSEIIQTPVGADVSCTPPIYRPSVALRNIPRSLVKTIIVPAYQYNKYTFKCGQSRPDCEKKILLDAPVKEKAADTDRAVIRNAFCNAYETILW